MLNNTDDGDVVCQHERYMSDPRNAAHDKRVTHKKQKSESPEPPKIETAAVTEIATAQSSAALEGSLEVLAKLKDLEFHSRANLERLAELQLTVEDELKQKDLAGPLGDVYSAQSAVQTKLTELIEAYKTECERLQG